MTKSAAPMTQGLATETRVESTLTVQKPTRPSTSPLCNAWAPHSSNAGVRVGLPDCSSVPQNRAHTTREHARDHPQVQWITTDGAHPNCGTKHRRAQPTPSARPPVWPRAKTRNGVAQIVLLTCMKNHPNCAQFVVQILCNRSCRQKNAIENLPHPREIVVSPGGGFSDGTEMPEAAATAAISLALWLTRLQV